MRALACLILAILVLPVAVFPALAWQDAPEATPAPESPIPPVTWQLVEASLADGTVHTPDDPSRYTIQFLPDGTVAMQADCNSGGGTFEIDGSMLSMPALRTTLIACPEDSLGDQFGLWLSEVTSFELTDDALILSLTDGGTLRFEAALGGVTWEWHEYQSSDDAVTAPQNPDAYTLRFEDNNHALIRADCNIGSGTVKIDGGMIAIDGISLTRMACAEPSLERDYVRLLDDVGSYLFVAGRLALVLPMDAGTMLFTATPIEDDETGDAMATPEGDA
jgi:heat shock protein HslJ